MRPDSALSKQQVIFTKRWAVPRLRSVRSPKTPARSGSPSTAIFRTSGCCPPPALRTTWRSTLRLIPQHGRGFLRLRTGLTAVYAFHRHTGPMFTRAAGDLEQIPVLREVLAPLFGYWERLRAVLCVPGKVSGHERMRVRALVGHAISFQTWRSLAREQKLRAPRPWICS